MKNSSNNIPTVGLQIDVYLCRIFRNVKSIQNSIDIQIEMFRNRDDSFGNLILLNRTLDVEMYKICSFNSSR